MSQLDWGSAGLQQTCIDEPIEYIKGKSILFLDPICYICMKKPMCSMVGQAYVDYKCDMQLSAILLHTLIGTRLLSSL